MAVWLLFCSCLAARTRATPSAEATAGARTSHAAETPLVSAQEQARLPTAQPAAPRPRGDDAPPNREATQQARARVLGLLSGLARSPSYALGHEDSTAYGVGWSGADDRSDVKSLCGAHVAVHGWDVFGLEKGAAKNGDGVEFARMRRLIVAAHRRGGINTISWHVDNPVSGKNAWDRTRAVHEILPGKRLHERYVGYLDRVASFLLTLVGDQGELVPIIFRPFHEHTGSWFWWGAAHTNAADYIALWRFTVDHLRGARGLDHLLFAFSPGGGELRRDADYLYRYPGDEYVDVFGVDHYYGNRASELVRVAEVVVRVAEKRGKIPALTEVGARGGLNAAGIDADWVLASLVGPLAKSPIASRIAYALAWRNASADHCFLPYPGHAGARSFESLCNDARVVLENDLARFDQ
jgi:mannan endo-1,4-beta-mannosidase